MRQETEQFFEQLAQRKHEPLLDKVKDSIRVEISVNGARNSWIVAVDEGAITVSSDVIPGEVGLVFRAPDDIFAGLATGERNAIAAFLRGEVELEGDWELAVIFQRLFPAPPDNSAQRKSTARSRRKR
jgi:putative sterol carrier protein